jgi:3-hydroxyacyl-[acyl-carrier-protein] dehydratase
MIACGEEILQYIPQRPPMVMVDKLLVEDERSAVTGLNVDFENIFVRNGFFTEPGIVEHIAQSAALKAGYGFAKAGKTIPIGYIAGVKDLSISYLPEVNAELVTRIEIVNQVMGVTLVQGTVQCSGRPVASCQMRIFIKA